MSKVYPNLRYSLVIPCYNEQDYLKNCLNSVLAQRTAFNEVIVVDNNSTDQSKNIALSYKGVRIVTCQEQGIAAARSLGFRKATGDVVCRIDADTILDESWLEEVINQIEVLGYDAVSGPTGFYDSKNQRLCRLVLDLSYFRFNKVLIGHWPLFGSSMAIKKSHLPLLQVNDPGILEDLDLSLRLGSGSMVGMSNQLDAKVSMRSAHLGLASAVKYMIRWPRTYMRFGKPFKAAMAFLFCVWLAGLSPVVLSRKGHKPRGSVLK